MHNKTTKFFAAKLGRRALLSGLIPVLATPALVLRPSLLFAAGNSAQDAVDDGLLVFSQWEVEWIATLAHDYLPQPPDWPEVDAVKAVDRYLYGIGSDQVNAFRGGFILLDLLPVFLGFGFRRGRRMDSDTRRQYIEAIASHDMYEIRNIGRMVQGLMQMAYYVDPEVEEKVGYQSYCLAPLPKDGK